ncbi:MAG: hypothetical protein ABSC65_19470 [Acidobacteriaceae bacterium]|jgi:hypothetical protein
MSEIDLMILPQTILQDLRYRARFRDFLPPSRQIDHAVQALAHSAKRVDRIRR